jgi:hypothetical protein
MKHTLALTTIITVVIGVALLFIEQGKAQGTVITYLPLAMESPVITPYNLTEGGNGASYAPSANSDGTLVAFLSDATNLVAEDTNGATDAFVWNRTIGQFWRVSVASDGTEANGVTTHVWVSGNGQYVLYISGASNLVQGDTNDRADLFRYDLSQGVTELVSVLPDGAAAGAAGNAAISEDGNTILFTSEANITGSPWPTTCAQGPCTALFRRDMAAGVTTAAVTEPDGTIIIPIRTIYMSADGDAFAYARIENVGTVCGEYCFDVFGQVIWHYNRTTEESLLVARSEASSIAHTYYNKMVTLRGLLADGTQVAYFEDFEASSSSGGSSSVGLLMKEGTVEATALYSIASASFPVTNALYSMMPDTQFTASASGEVIVFAVPDLNREDATPYIAEDDNGYIDLFHYQNSLYLRLNNLLTTNAMRPSISADGNTLYFESVATTEPNPDRTDIFVAHLP